MTATIATTAVTFDTLKFVRTLESAGVSSAQAEAFSTAVQNAQEAAQLATKADLGEVRAEIRQYESTMRKDLEKLEVSLRHEISDVRNEMGSLRKDLTNEIKLLEKSMTIKLGSMIMAAVGLIVALNKLL